MRNNNSHIIFENNFKQIVELYWKSNKSVNDIAPMFGLNQTTLRRYMIKYRLLKPVGQSSRKYNSNEDFFETIDSEIKAYWLGVLYADGCLQSIHTSKYIVLSSIDKNWINEYKKAVGFDGLILTEHHKYFNTDIYKVKITSKKMYADLIRNGIVEKKSCIISFPNNDIVPDNLMPHFIRGYFDGNGSVGWYQNMRNSSWKRLHVSFCSGSEIFINGLYSYLTNIGIKSILKPKKRKNRNTYILDLSVKTGKELRDYMYKDATIFLERKHEKYFAY